MGTDDVLDRPVLSMDELAGLFDHMADGVYVVDSDQRIQYWSDAAEQITGLPRHAVLGQQCYDVMGGTDYEGRCYCRKDCATILCARQGEAVPSYDILARPGERRLWINVSIMPVRTPEFDQPLAVHIFRDASRSKISETVLDDTVTSVVHHLPPSKAPTDHRPATEALTPREMEVLRLLAAGATVRDIALELVITRATVRAHIEHLMNKLGAHSRLQAVAVAARRGLL